MFTIYRKEGVVKIMFNGPVKEEDIPSIHEQLDEVTGWSDRDMLDITAGIHGRGLSKDERGFIVERLIPEIERKGVTRISFLD